MTIRPASLLLALALIGCASQPAPEPEKVQLPEWIAQGKQTWGNETDGFFGVGTGSPEITDVAERQSAAEDQARGAALHEFEGWYSKWLEAHPGKAPDRAEANVDIVERWMGPDGRTFALAHLKADFVTGGDSSPMP